DPPLRRRLHIDIVDADAGPADHLEAFRRLDPLPVDVGRAANDQPVEPADPLEQLLTAPIGPDGHLDAWRLPQAVDAFGGDRLAHEHPQRHEAQTSMAAPTPAPRGPCRPILARAYSIAPRIVTMSRGVAAPMWPI